MLKIIFILLFLSNFALGQSFQQLAPFGVDGRDDGVAFSIGKYGYLITGNMGGASGTSELLQFDPSQNTWVKKAPFTGIERQYAGQFVVNGKAYLCCGVSFSNQTLKDVWEYDPQTDHWTQKQDFPGEERRAFFTFSLLDCGILGTGYNQNKSFDDCWKYNPLEDSWSQIASFPGGERREVVGLSLAEKCFAGTGISGSPDKYNNDFYEYHVMTDTWTRINDFPGVERAYAVAQGAQFVGIVGSGWKSNGEFYKDFYQINRKGEWSSFTDFPNGGIRGMSSFTIGNSIYLTTGLTENFARVADLYLVEMESVDQLELYPNPSVGKSVLVAPIGTQFSLYDEKGLLILEQPMPDLGYYELPDLSAGIYLIKSNKVENGKVLRYVVVGK